MGLTDQDRPQVQRCSQEQSNARGTEALEGRSLSSAACC